MVLEQLLSEAKKHIGEKVVSIFKEEGAKAAFTKLYTLLPLPVRLFVKEETFINFCKQHQDKLFGNQQPAKKVAPKKTALKKASPKKAAKKVAKKTVAKKTAAKKK